MPFAETLIDGRYRVVACAGQGGFGSVFRAVDAVTSREVAVKTLDGVAVNHARFAREAEVLSILSHPNVVSYVAHGRTAEGTPYLVMDWLEGCDLATKLSSGPLPLEDALRLGVQVAQGLAAAHREGVVHRDVKPSNVFLVGGEPSDVRVIDFGIAGRTDSGIAGRTEALLRLTQTGALVGTPAYMAPEQARGTRGSTPRVDVFALGCVLYECLTGAPAFSGVAQAVLAQIVSGATPRASSRCPNFPRAVDDLLARMMAYDPMDRFADAATAALAISEVLGTPSDRAAPRFSGPLVTGRVALTHSTLLVEADQDIGPDAIATVESFGGSLHHESKRTLVATFELGTAYETARRTARCALELMAADSRLAIAILTSRSDTVAAAPDAVRRQLHLGGVTPRPGKVLIDATTSRLLQQSFEVERIDGATWLTGGQRAPADQEEGAFVGRARELAAIDGIYAEVTSEHCARLLLVLGESGIGKSRLLQVATTRLGRLDPAPMVLRAHADVPTRASPFALLRSFVRDRCAGGDASVLRETLERGGLTRIDAAFLCELAGLGVEDAAVVAARRDPIAMADAFRCAWLAFCEDELRRQPLVLVLEDLHFADAASVRLLHASIAELGDLPLLVIASARPDEARALLETLEKTTEPERLLLQPLRRGVAVELVEAHLERADPAAVDRIVEHAAGNPLRLVELARLARDGGADAVDEGFEARILRLPREAQRVVRAASVFGVRFTVDGVASLLGSEAALPMVEAGLEAAKRARIVRSPSSKDGPFEFVHGSVQEATYALLPDDDRRAAHGMVARWLGKRPGADRSVVAWHFERAAERSLARDWYATAARAALVGGELERAIELADRALDAEPEGEDLATIALVRAEAAFARGDTTTARDAAQRARDAATPGTLPWLGATTVLLGAAGQAGDNDRVIALADEVRAERSRGPDCDAARVVCLGRAIIQLLVGGRHEAARSLLEAACDVKTDAPEALALAEHARAGFFALEHDYERALATMERAARLQALAGNLRASALARLHRTGHFIFAGDFAGALGELEIVEPLARRTGADFYVRWARYSRAKVLAFTGRPEEARSELEAVRREIGKNPRIVAGAHVHAAIAALRAGDGLWAESESREAMAVHPSPSIQSASRGALACALVLQDRPEEALVAAEEARRILDDTGRLEENESIVHLALPLALSAAGRDDAARAAVQAAAFRLRDIAKKLSQPAKREAYLHGIFMHGETLRLAFRLGVDVDAS